MTSTATLVARIGAGLIGGLIGIAIGNVLGMIVGGELADPGLGLVGRFVGMGIGLVGAPPWGRSLSAAPASYSGASVRRSRWAPSRS